MLKPPLLPQVEARPLLSPWIIRGTTARRLVLLTHWNRWADLRHLSVPRSLCLQVEVGPRRLSPWLCRSLC